MHVSKLLIGSFLLALGVTGCSDDTTPGPSPTPDSGNPPADTGTPGDDGGDAQDAGETIPPGDMRPCGASTIAVGDTTAKLTHMGVEYSYLVHVPPTYDGSKRTPLVINWHGAFSSGVQEQFYTQTDPLADAEGFIVVYPTSPNGIWATGTCCSQFRDAGGADRDDVGFARALVAQISSVACIDAKKTYSIGLSNGGFMSHRLACEAADAFAAVVSVAGKMGVSPCNPSRPVPVLQFHGTADTTIPYDKDAFSTEGVDVPGMMALWATRDGCTKGPATTFQMGNSTCQAWSQCSGGAEVKLCTQTGDEHCWPGATFCFGGLPYTMDISATKESWKFLRRFALP